MGDDDKYRHSPKPVQPEEAGAALWGSFACLHRFLVRIFLELSLGNGECSGSAI